MSASTDDQICSEEDYCVMYERAVDEWNNVPAIVCQKKKPLRGLGVQQSSEDNTTVSSGRVPQSVIPQQSWVEFGEMWSYCSTMPLPSVKDDSVSAPITNPGWLRSVLNRLSGIPPLNTKLVSEQHRVLAISHCQLNNDDIRHVKMLTSIYRKLSDCSTDCPRYGEHWQEIGFQGNDPATDLRGCGILSLLCTLFSLSTPEYRPLVLRVYRLSCDSRQHFPFMVMCINLTRLCLHALRRGALNRECNRRKAVMLVLCDCFVCLLCEFYRRWRDDDRTISDSGNLLKELDHVVLNEQRRLRCELARFLLSSVNGQ